MSLQQCEYCGENQEDLSVEGFCLCYTCYRKLRILMALFGVVVREELAKEEAKG